MAQCSENIALYIVVSLIKTIKHVFDLFAFGCFGCRTRVDKNRKSVFSGEFSDDCFIHKGQWPNHGKFSLKKNLGWNHGADFTGITYIQKQRFDEVIFVVTKRQLSAAQLVRDFKQPLSPQM